MFALRVSGYTGTGKIHNKGEGSTEKGTRQRQQTSTIHEGGGRRKMIEESLNQEKRNVKKEGEKKQQIN